MSPEMQKRMQELAGGKDISELSQEERRNLFQQMRSQLGGQGGQGGPAGAPGAGPAAAAAPTGEFTPAQRKAATLPRPPEQGSDVEILLRPGLLADAEIIVDSMKDVVYVPYQTVFDTPQGHIVYLWNGKALEQRKVELGRRSESQVVIASGLEEGDMISLEPPESERRDKKTPKKKSGGAPKTGVPGGGMPGGRGGMI